MRALFRQGIQSSLDVLSPGSWLICILALVSSLVVALWSIPHKQGMVFWTFAKSHKLLYDPMTEVWNNAHEQKQRVHILLLSAGALQRQPDKEERDHGDDGDRDPVARLCHSRAPNNPCGRVSSTITISR